MRQKAIAMENIFAFISVVVGVAVIIGFAVLFLRLVDRLTLGPEPTPEQREEAMRRYEERLSNPQWDKLEQHYGFPMPIALRELYEDPKLVTRSSYYVVPRDAFEEGDEHFVSSFHPADVETINSIWFECGTRRFPFACDGFDNHYYVRFRTHCHDPPVYFIDHDGGDCIRIADSLNTFLSWKTYVDSDW